MQAKRVDDWGYCSDYCEFYLGVSVFYLNVTMIKFMETICHGNVSQEIEMVVKDDSECNGDVSGHVMDPETELCMTGIQRKPMKGPIHSLPYKLHIISS